MSSNEMTAVLKQLLVPALRERGFMGSFPHFRRLRDNRIDVLGIQFDKYGGGFVVELAQAPATGVTTPWGKFIPPDKLTVTFLSRRLRLGAKDENSDHWFRFDGADPQSIVQEVLRLLGVQGESWWSAGESISAEGARPPL